MSTHRLIFQGACTIKIQLSLLVWYKADIIITSMDVTYSRHDIAEKLLIWH